MVGSQKKVDNRIRTLIENGVRTGHRSLFVIVGDKGHDQLATLHHMLAKAEIKARPTVLWCYKTELGFSSNRRRRMKEVRRRVQSGEEVDRDNPFDQFIASTTIRYCYYSETHKILGNTFGMCLLQDFEGLTPNLLARTIETVEGGGIIVILLRTVSSLKQLFTMTMDVHSRYRTDAHKHVVGRFNERFILSLRKCDSCIVMDDSLNVLPISSSMASIAPVPTRTTETTEDFALHGIKESLKGTPLVGVLISCCKTKDQAQAVLKFIDSISEKKLDATVSLTAARGRGKSAALGLAMAAAVGFGYSNIYVTSPSPENLKTLFDFVLKGFDALEYEEHTDYELIQSTNPEFKNSIVRVNVFHGHRQTIQYIHPTDAQKLGQAELLVIDEAAAIPLPLVKSLFGPYLIFLASTISGYEGTGRSLSMKLIHELRISGASDNRAATGSATNTVKGRILREVTLEESIRYKPGDKVERWLIDLLCLDATLTPSISSGYPPPEKCELYYINRETLFSGHNASEKFLQKIMALFVSSHYKNSPNDLQLMSDAPAHHLFCLIDPAQEKTIPDVFCAIQICLEGKISADVIKDAMKRGTTASGDLIPWTLLNQFQFEEVGLLSGARIVRLATHPDYQRHGYGSRAVQLLKEYYRDGCIDFQENLMKSGSKEIETVQDEELGLLKEQIAPRMDVPIMLTKLAERPNEGLDYLGVSYGLTHPLLMFWKRLFFVPLYIRQTTNDLTGEHSCLMLHAIRGPLSSGGGDRELILEKMWIRPMFADFRRRFLSLLSYNFKTFSPSLALEIIRSKLPCLIELRDGEAPMGFHPSNPLTSPIDRLRIDRYINNMIDYHTIMDLVPSLARHYFLQKQGDVKLSPLQQSILLGLGLQCKTVDEVSKEIDVPANQLLSLFLRSVRKLTESVDKTMSTEENDVSGINFVKMLPIPQTLAAELEQSEKEMKKKQAAELERLKKDDLSQYVIKGNDETWSKTLASTSKPKQSSVSIKTGEKRIGEEEGNDKKKKRQPDSKEGEKRGFGKGWKKGGGGRKRANK